MVERMETEHTEPLEILPVNIGSLPATETAPLLTRAASRIDIVRPKNDFWKGMRENLNGAAGWIEAQRTKFKGRTLNMIATASLITTMVAACSKPPETPYIPTEAPRVTEVIPTEMPLPTETPTLEPTPTLELSPTPTEIPMFEGELIDLSEALTRGERVDVSRHHEQFLGVDFYRVDTLPVTLVSTFVDPETGVGQEVWGFQSDGKDYLFRTASAENFIPEAPDIHGGVDANDLTIGKHYRLLLQGLENPMVDSDYWTDVLSGELNLPARSMYEKLRIDSDDPQRLYNYLMTGDPEGFDADSEGIVDLTGVVELRGAQ